MNNYSGLLRINGLNKNTLALAITSAISMPVAHANDRQELPTTTATVQTPERYKIDQSTSIKQTQPLLDTAKTITVIGQSVMKDRNVDSLRDALRNVPGISMAAGEGGTPTGDSMSIRGFSARNDIMIDNVRDIAGYSRDTYNIEAIEVSKGPGSAATGRGATGGSINLQTKLAKLDDFTDISIKTGNSNDYRAQLDTNNSIGDSAALRLNLLTDDGDVAGRDSVNNSKQAIALSLATGIGSDTRLNINFDRQDQDNLPDYGLPWVPNNTGNPTRQTAPWLSDRQGQTPNVPFSNFYGNTRRDFEDILVQSMTLQVEKDLSQSAMLRTLIRTGSVKRHSIVTAPRFAVTKINGISVYGEPAGKITMADEKTRDTKDSLAVLQMDLIAQYDSGYIQHDIVTGIEIAKEQFKRWNMIDVNDDNLDSTPVYNDFYHPDPNLAYTGKYQRDGNRQRATGDSKAIYGFDTLTWNPQWQTTVGLRWDSFSTDYQYSYSDPSLRIAAKDHALSWNLGVVYKPVEQGSLYFGSGNSFSPSAEDLTASTNGNNNELDPEETISYELGVKWQFLEGKLFTQAAIFRTDKNHARTDDPFGQDRNDDTLAGKQRVDGIELSAAGQFTEQFSLTGAYTYQDSEVVTALGLDSAQQGNPLPRTPKHSLSLWGRYDLSSALAIGLGAQYVGERFNSSDPGSRETADDYLIFDLMIAYQINEQLSVQFNGNNLTDRDYVDQIGGGHFIPGEGRYLALSASYSF